MKKATALAGSALALTTTVVGVNAGATPASAYPCYTANLTHNGSVAIVHAGKRYFLGNQMTKGPAGGDCNDSNVSASFQTGTMKGFNVYGAPWSGEVAVVAGTISPWKVVIPNVPANAGFFHGHTTYGAVTVARY